MLKHLRATYTDWTWHGTRAQGARGGWAYCGTHARKDPVVVFKFYSEGAWYVRKLGRPIGTSKVLGDWRDWRGSSASGKEASR